LSKFYVSNISSNNLGHEDCEIYKFRHWQWKLQQCGTIDIQLLSSLLLINKVTEAVQLTASHALWSQSSHYCWSRISYWTDILPVAQPV